MQGKAFETERDARDSENEMKVCALPLAALALAVSVMPLSLLHAAVAVGPSNSAELGVSSSAIQDPTTQTAGSPPRQAGVRRHHRTPKAELFLGFSHFGAGTNFTSGTSGNRMVGLNGGEASIAFNFNRYIGIVGDFSGYDDSQLLLTGTGANQPLTVNASGTVFPYLFGPKFSFRNDSRITPFVQVLAGGVHASAVTVANCAGTGCSPLPVQNAFAMTAGGGIDIRLTRLFSLRAVQAEYMMTRFPSVPSGASSSQNDLRLSSGLVMRFGGSEPMLPVQLACSVQPDSVFPGDALTATATATNLRLKHPVTYHWSTNGGAISGSDSTAQINTAGIAPGTYTVSGHVTQGSHPSEQADCTASFTIQAFAPPTISCSASPSTVTSGDTATITAQAMSPQNRPLTYAYSANMGTVTGNGATAVLNTTGVGPGSITVNCTVVDDLGKTALSNTSVNVQEPTPVAAVAPQVQNLCSLSFERDRKRPVRVDNEAKACLDDVALKMQHESSGHLVIVGDYAADEKPETGARRAKNAREYLTKEKGIDSQSIELRIGTGGRTATNVFVPVGATYAGDGTTPVE